MQPMTLLLLVLLVLTASGFTLEGNWTNNDTRLTISDLVYRNSTLLSKMLFTRCSHTMLLQAQVSQNMLFINLNSQLIQTNPDPPTCLKDDSAAVLSTLFSTLSRVFYFQINLDRLILQDPYDSTLLTFQRQLNKDVPSLVGEWTLNHFGSTRTALQVLITPQNITLCQGQAVYNYSIGPQRHQLLFKTVKNNCPSKQLTQAAKAVKYFRKKGDHLDLYDENIAVVMGLAFSAQYDPSKAVENQAPSVPPTASASTDNLKGEWAVQSLFGIAFPNSPYSLGFDEGRISLKGGCNSHSFPYTHDSKAQIVTVDSSKGVSTLKLCLKDDDQLYVSGITKMYKYLNSNGGNTLTFYDQAGNPGFKLTRKGKVASKAEQAFSPGVVLMLLLKRRDLPRAIVNVTADSLAYSLCNSIRHSLSVTGSGSSGSMSVGAALSTRKACPVDNDRLYSAALESAVTFSYEAATKTVLLKDKSGQEVVSLTQAS